MEHTIQRIHIRSIFGLFIPLCSVNDLEARPHVAEDYFGFSLFNSVGGLRYNIHLFCRQGVSKEYEQCNCFDWAKRNPISFQSSDGINGTVIWQSTDTTQSIALNSNHYSNTLINVEEKHYFPFPYENNCNQNSAAFDIQMDDIDSTPVQDELL